jgi:hypothetical protein
MWANRRPSISPATAFAFTVGVHHTGLVPITSNNDSLSDNIPKTFNSRDPAAQTNRIGAEEQPSCLAVEGFFLKQGGPTSENMQRKVLLFNYLRNTSKNFRWDGDFVI